MTVLYLNSAGIGNGDKDLAELLMYNFLEKLLAASTHIDHIICMNSGVFLATGEGPALELLQEFGQSGTQISSCCTCLDHYELNDSLKVGKVGTMEETVRLLTTADRIITV